MALPTAKQRAQHVGLIPVQREVHRKSGRHEQTFWIRAQSKPVAKTAAGKPGAAPGSQLHPNDLARLKALGVRKLPAAHISEVHVAAHLHNDAHPALHEKALAKWTDDKGRVQSVYSAHHDARQAEKKWERAGKLEAMRDKVIKDLTAKAPHSDAHAAALVIAHTGLRIGGAESLAKEGHYGVSTMEVRHIAFEGTKAARISYIGKDGQVNRATITDPGVVKMLKSHVEGKAPGASVFHTHEDEVRATMPAGGYHPKDLRTVMAARTAREQLRTMPPPPTMTGDKRKDAREVGKAIRLVAAHVAKTLNNTPAVALKSYVPPQVFRDWAQKNGFGAYLP